MAGSNALEKLNKLLRKIDAEIKTINEKKTTCQNDPSRVKILDTLCFIFDDIRKNIRDTCFILEKKNLEENPDPRLLSDTEELRGGIEQDANENKAVKVIEILLKYSPLIIDNLDERGSLIKKILKNCLREWESLSFYYQRENLSRALSIKALCKHLDIFDDRASITLADFCRITSPCDSLSERIKHATAHNIIKPRATIARDSSWTIKYMVKLPSVVKNSVVMPSGRPTDSGLRKSVTPPQTTHLLRLRLSTLKGPTLTAGPGHFPVEGNPAKIVSPSSTDSDARNNKTPPQKPIILRVKLARKNHGTLREAATALCPA